jgi:O-antigen ligase
MGLWDNPNTYGMLMGAGGLLAIGLLAANAKLKIKNSKTNWFLGIAVFLLGIGLLMSYSRGAWLATAIGVLYLAWSYGKLKWRYVLPVAAVAAVVVLFLWGSTPDSAPWYVKRADLGRPSAQHRATAWRAGLEMMRDHPFGVGWNNAVSVYAKDYSPPEDGAAAITTNDYLMLGTQLGIPALLCFVAYVGLCFRGKCSIKNEEGRIQAACRAGALVFVVAFWFDGGLFKLPTAALFWVLLELGVAQQMPDPASVGKLVAANH